MEESHIWIISTRGDRLSVSVSKKLRKKNIPVIFSIPSKIAEQSLVLIENKLYVDDKLITGILFRAKPDSSFSESFIEQDRLFCDSEIGALILASMNLPTLLSINKYDAQVWFDKSSWSGWRNRCINNNIKVAPFSFGNINLNGSSVWLPYNSYVFRVKPHIEVRKVLGAALTESTPYDKYLLIGGRTFYSNSNYAFNDHISFLEKSGIYLSEMTTDSEGNLITINTLPSITDKNILEDVSNMLVKEYYDFVYSRRS